MKSNELLVSLLVALSFENVIGRRNLKNDKDTTSSPVTNWPTIEPSEHPTYSPSKYPTTSPSKYPSEYPTTSPSKYPTYSPSVLPTTSQPSLSEPSTNPTAEPTSKAPTFLPSEMPSWSPVSSHFPTLISTTAPTEPVGLVLITSRPTEEPPMPPSFSPSASPSLPPSATPTGAVLVTALPTDNFKQVPTPSPSIPPSEVTGYPTSDPAAALSSSPSLITSLPTTSVPSIAPSANVSTSGFEVATLPEMKLAFDVVSGQVEKEKLGEDIESFVNATIFFNTRKIGNLSYIDVEVWISTIVISNRRLVERMEAIVAGVAYFENGATPSTERIHSVLKAYFANWGGENFRTHLSSGSFEVDNVSVELDGEMVESALPDPEEDGDEVQGVEEQNISERSSVSRGLIAGLVVGCCALVIALGLLVWQRKQDKKSDKSENANQSTPPIVNAEALEADRSKDITPRIQQEDMSFAGYSIADESMYTTNTEEQFSSAAAANSSDQYDAKRLDKVISNAHQFVATHEDPFDPER